MEDSVQKIWTQMQGNSGKVKENLDGTLDGINKILEDPFCILENIAQGVTDTCEREGIAYCGGYGIGIYAGAKGIAEGAKSLKGVGGKGGKYSGDLMSVEDATKYSEHWRELGIGSDKTWNAFKTANPSATIDDYFKLVKEQSPWPDGYNPNNNIVSLKEGDTFNIVLDKKQKVSRPGGFAIVDDVPNVEFARNDMAIKLDWKDDCGKIATYRVKSGIELNVPSGPIGPQIDLTADKYLTGNMGLTQLDLFNGLGRINRTDYIEVVPGSVRRLN